MTYHQPVLRVRNLSLHLNSQKVLVDDSPVALTTKEYLVLEFLMRHKGAVLSKGAIVDYIYGAASDRDAKIVDIFVWKLRKKLADAGAGQMIGTAWGRGFIITEPRGEHRP